jgi:asparagine synthetase B (glutamine-hydrolysing)
VLDIGAARDSCVRTVANVPVAFFSSAGIDSSLIATLARRPSAKL